MHYDERDKPCGIDLVSDLSNYVIRKSLFYTRRLLKCVRVGGCRAARPGADSLLRQAVEIHHSGSCAPSIVSEVADYISSNRGPRTDTSAALTQARITYNTCANRRVADSD
jgi:hypothetical protein